jgi:hypothetical protein
MTLFRKKSLGAAVASSIPEPPSPRVSLDDVIKASMAFSGKSREEVTAYLEKKKGAQAQLMSKLTQQSAKAKK